MAGNEMLRSQLAELGYQPTVPLDVNGNPTDFVAFKFTIPHGRFRGQEVEIALTAPQFPSIPPSGPYIRPHLMPITGGGGLHPTGGVHQYNMPTPEFQYWSRPCASWSEAEKNVKSYISFLRTLFDFE